MQEIKSWKVWSNFFGYFIIFILGASIAAIPRFIKGFDNETGLLVSISEIIRIFITILLLYWYTKYVVKLPLNIPTLKCEISKYRLMDIDRFEFTNFDCGNILYHR